MTNAPSLSHTATRKDLNWILGIAFFVLLFDYATKIWAVGRLKDQPPLDIIPGVFRFAYGENTGIAFGMLTNQGGLLLFLSPIAFVVLLVILYKMFAQNAMDAWFRLIFGLLIGGALGNITNRLYCGYVVDFIDVFIGSYNWPTFNIADSALTVGEVILISKIILEEFSVRKTSALPDENAAESKTD